MFILTPFAKLCNNSEDGAPIETPQRLVLKNDWMTSTIHLAVRAKPSNTQAICGDLQSSNYDYLTKHPMT